MRVDRDGLHAPLWLGAPGFGCLHELDDLLRCLPLETGASACCDGELFECLAVAAYVFLGHGAQPTVGTYEISEQAKGGARLISLSPSPALGSVA